MKKNFLSSEENPNDVPNQRFSFGDPDRCSAKADPDHRLAKADPDRRLAKADPDHRLAKADPDSAPLRLVVGMGTIDDYIPLAEAGADEIFCGYIPVDWLETFGNPSPMNRREVLYTNVQIGSFSELKILRDMVKDYHVPVSLTLNRPAYEPEMLDFLRGYMRQCGMLGFRHFIVADPALLTEQDIHDEGDSASGFPQMNENAGSCFHLSGEYGELNHLVLEELLHKSGTALTRIIFPRQTTLAEMEQLIRFMESAGHHLEYEAFAFNEKCHFTGAYCNSLHSDYFCHMCLLPYVPVKRSASEAVFPSVNTQTEVVKMTDSSTTTDLMRPSVEAAVPCPGDSGCGLCAFYRLKSIGVTHLKIVSRGNYTDSTLEDLRLLRRALSILERSGSEASYIRQMKRDLFPDGCAGNCYYREFSF